MLSSAIISSISSFKASVWTWGGSLFDILARILDLVRGRREFSRLSSFPSSMFLKDFARLCLPVSRAALGWELMVATPWLLTPTTVFEEARGWGPWVDAEFQHADIQTVRRRRKVENGEWEEGSNMVALKPWIRTLK
jgi:hypothetical protein